MFDAEKFVQEVVEELRRRIKGKAVIGISGAAVIFGAAYWLSVRRPPG